MGDCHRRETAELASKRFKVLVNDSSDYAPSLVTQSLEEHMYDEPNSPYIMATEHLIVECGRNTKSK